MSILKLKQKKGENIDRDEIEALTTDPWKGARITTVPLDFALSLSFQSKPGLYFKLSPADDDVEDALAIEGKSDLAENKVPLFYVEDFKIKEDKDDSDDVVPLYFRKEELLDTWRKVNGDRTPSVKVTELFSVVKTMIDSNSTSDPDINRLSFIAPLESNKMAQQCKKFGGKSSAYQLGKHILIL